MSTFFKPFSLTCLNLDGLGVVLMRTKCVDCSLRPKKTKKILFRLAFLLARVYVPKGYEKMSRREKK